MWFVVGVLALAVALLIEERRGLLRIGARAPGFTSADAGSGTTSLRELSGNKALILYFYPKDFTAGCTKEACGFRDHLARIQTLDGAILGVSHDSSASHEAFGSRHSLQFPLLSDPDGSLRRRYGVLRLGGLIPLTKRVTYVIDRNGIVRAVIHDELFMNRHVDKAIAVLEKLKSGEEQISDSK